MLLLQAFLPFWQPIVKAALPEGASLPDLGFFPTSGACFVQYALNRCPTSEFTDLWTRTDTLGLLSRAASWRGSLIACPS